MSKSTTLNNVRSPFVSGQNKRPSGAHKVRTKMIPRKSKHKSRDY